jgi:hypothetical protein
MAQPEISHGRPPKPEPGGSSERRAPEPKVGDDPIWSLCASGATLGQICEQLSRPAAEIASQLADGARLGKALDVPRLLGRDRFDAIRAAAQGAGDDVVALRKRLPFPAAIAEIRLALL